MPLTRHLEESTIELAKKIRRLKATEAADDTDGRPRDINHWLIPGAVLATIGLWITTAVALADTHADPTTGDTLLLVTAAAVTAATTTLYIKDYVLQRTMARDHQMILDAVNALRRDVTAHREVYKDLFTDLIKRLDAIENAGWEDAAAQVSALVAADGTGVGSSVGNSASATAVGRVGAHVLPMTRRPTS